MSLEYEIILCDIIEWKFNHEEPSEVMSSNFTYLLQRGVSSGVHGHLY